MSKFKVFSLWTYSTLVLAWSVMVMKQTKHLFAIAFTILLATTSAIPLAKAGHGFGGHGFGGHGFGGHGFRGLGLVATVLAVTDFADLVATLLVTTRLVVAGTAAASTVTVCRPFVGTVAHGGITLPITNSISLMSRTNMASSPPITSSPPIICIMDSAIAISPIISFGADGSEDMGSTMTMGSSGPDPCSGPSPLVTSSPSPSGLITIHSGTTVPISSLPVSSGHTGPMITPTIGLTTVLVTSTRAIDGIDRAYAAQAESPTDIAEACSGVAPGLTGLPMDRIEKTLQPSGEQRASFDELKAASAKAEEIMKASCPSEIPLTPISQLDAAEKRVDAMMQAVQALRAPLDTFYNSLTEEQKRRLDSLANRGGHNKAGETITQLCSDSAARFTNLPSEQIQQTVQPKEQQMPAFEALKAASSKAANILNGTCPSETPSTPGDRLDAMAKRLNATAQALNTVRPALQDFYASLDDEQKARFNTMNKQAQRQG